MSGINDLLGRHPIATYAIGGLMLLSSLFVLVTDGGEGSESAEALAAARSFFEQNAEVEVSERDRQVLGRDFVDVVSHAYDLQKDEGAGPIFHSERMQQRTQRRFEALADEAFNARMRDFPAWRLGIGHEGTPIPNYLLHVFAHETLLALVVSLLFFVLAGIGLEAAWGSAIFGGFCLLGTVLPALAFRFLDAEGGVPLSGATGLVAALLAAYAVRGAGGNFNLPAWLLMPVWVFVELLFVRAIWIDNFQIAPLATIGVGAALGIVVALSMKIFKLEKKLVDLSDSGSQPLRHPALDLAERAEEEGNPGTALEALRKAHAEVPKNREVALAYWTIARERGEAADAISAILPVLRDCVRFGDAAKAIGYWTEITTYVSDVEVEPALAIRIGESLLDDSQPEAALDALRRAVEHPRGLGTGLAQRVVRVARDLDPELTHRAAAIALEDVTLDEATREGLEALVDEVRASIPPLEPATPEAAPAPAPAPPQQTTRRPADSDIDLDSTDELTDPEEFAQQNHGSAPVGSQTGADPDDVDPNALSLQSLEREFSGDLGMAEGEELTDPNAEDWNDPSMISDLDKASEQAAALFDRGGLDGTPIEASAPQTPPAATTPTCEPGSGSDTAPLAPLSSSPTLASQGGGVAALGTASALTTVEPESSQAPPVDSLPPVGASPGIEDIARYQPTDIEHDSLSAPTPPASELAAPAPPGPSPQSNAPPRTAVPAASPAPPAPTPARGPIEGVNAPAQAVGRDLTDVVDITLTGGSLRRIKIVTGVPVGIKPDALEIEVEGRGGSKVPFARIDAVAVAAVSGLSAKPVLVIDLALNWLDDPDKPLKVIRLHSHRFNPSQLVPSEGSPLQALKRLVAGILQRSGATPLPDSGAVAGTPFKSFPDVAAYQRQVLCAEE
ncbi:MAG: rhomboid family intramembrane serine protease [Deltaproteobacteria bacterium]|nr:rhomboid family intramembrane serine protease [Deltaproteobacteria bacterium]